MEQWNMQALESDLPRMLASCHTEFERINVKALHGIEVRKLAERLRAENRLTPAGYAIANKYGFK